MASRSTLLLALALAGSATPAFAAAEADPAGASEAQEVAAPAAAMKAARPRPRIVVVQPPARPEDLGEPSAAGATPDDLPMPPIATAEISEAAPAGPIVKITPPQRPAFATDAAVTVAAVEAAPASTPSLFAALFGPRTPAAPPADPDVDTGRPQLDAMIAHHAKLNGVPASLVHRIVVRESRYNPRAVGRGGAMGLMQIKTGTARALGYEGGPSGLLDAETNITYAVKYLAGAYRTARGNFDLAVRHYAQGYYYAAKRQGLTRTASRSRRGEAVQEADASAAASQ